MIADHQLEGRFSPARRDILRRGFSGGSAFKKEPITGSTTRTRSVVREIFGATPSVKRTQSRVPFHEPPKRKKMLEDSEQQKKEKE